MDILILGLLLWVSVIFNVVIFVERHNSYWKGRSEGWLALEKMILNRAKKTEERETVLRLMQ